MELTTEEIVKLRRAMLMIANEIKRICEKHGIKYWLDGGSLIGAVRHNGFIPWDDDMDMGMLKEDYDRFCEIAINELDNKFFLDNYKTNNECPYAYTKIRLKGTIFLENIGNENLKHNEIFVDIFPYFHRPDDIREREINSRTIAIFEQMLMSKSGYKVYNGQGVKNRIKFLPIEILSHLYSRNQIISYLERIFSSCKETNTIGAQGAGSFKSKSFYKVSAFDEMVDHKFEECIFKIPKEYDYILRTFYGDYMTPPTKDNITTHNLRKLSFGEIDIN